MAACESTIRFGIIVLLFAAFVSFASEAISAQIAQPKAALTSIANSQGSIDLKHVNLDDAELSPEATNLISKSKQQIQEVQNAIDKALSSVA